MPSKQEYYKCNYCYTFFKDRIQTQQHEKLCTYNPQNKHCDSCRYRVLIENEDQVKEYICQKNYIIDKSFIACEGKEYSKAPIYELQKRANQKEFS